MSLPTSLRFMDSVIPTTTKLITSPSGCPSLRLYWWSVVLDECQSAAAQPRLKSFGVQPPTALDPDHHASPNRPHIYSAGFLHRGSWRLHWCWCCRATIATHIKATVRWCFATLQQVCSMWCSLSQHAICDLVVSKVNFNCCCFVITSVSSHRHVWSVV